MNNRIDLIRVAKSTEHVRDRDISFTLSRNRESEE